MKRGLKLIINSLLIAAIGVFVIDYFSHLFFSTPMETRGYFFVKAAFFFIFSLFFLRKEFVFKRFNTRFKNALFGGFVLASLFGIYYNIFPYFGFKTYGISLYGLSFLNMGLFGTGLAFGIVHTLGFVVGYYISKLVLGAFK